MKAPLEVVGVSERIAKMRVDIEDHWKGGEEGSSGNIEMNGSVLSHNSSIVRCHYALGVLMMIGEDDGGVIGVSKEEVGTLIVSCSIY